jgi:hypothetical protein
LKSVAELLEVSTLRAYKEKPQIKKNAWFIRLDIQITQFVDKGLDIHTNAAKYPLKENPTTNSCAFQHP